MNKRDEQALSLFGKHIRKLRKSRRLSQEQLADKAELHRTYIGMIERGEKNITLLNILKISTALEIEPYLLLMEFNN
ncbi:helix-turn-helix domain-containing protein [Acidithiobacillus ferrivorans]|uniref:helix-turn-helix domain-containing protein n=1 Tax=Acidithiobacillus ferrivorans TaxID=160808 RepID=UPI0009F1D4A4|nr:helix-turn-helix transcriptional regulator [Acidithiobacillus ferrivorans]